MTRERKIKRICGRLLYLVMGLFCVFFLFGCSTKMVVTPQVVQIANIDFQIKGKIIYDGNREYLPRVIVDESISDSGLTFQYTYNAIYGKHDVPEVVALFNPLNIVGFPTGENSLTIIGKLDILKGK